jgi:hypothetical protein
VTGAVPPAAEAVCDLGGELKLNCRRRAATAPARRAAGQVRHDAAATAD